MEVMQNTGELQWGKSEFRNRHGTRHLVYSGCLVFRIIEIKNSQYKKRKEMNMFRG